MSIFLQFMAELELEKLDTLLFRGNPNTWPNKHVFGGHVVAQAMEAASLTVEATFKLHSLHCYFLRPGIADQSIIYHVDPIKDGRSLVTRRVVAKQNGVAIFNISLSFHQEENGLSHQVGMMSHVPTPEDLDDDEKYNARFLEAYRKNSSADTFYMPFEMRSIDRIDPSNPTAKDPVTGYWFRLKEKIEDNPELHTRLLTYISDFSFLSSSLRPHAMTPQDKRLKTVASLDHTMWFHDPSIRVDDWIFYQTEGAWTGRGRGLARGSLYARDGKLLASTSQECLLRLD